MTTQPLDAAMADYQKARVEVAAKILAEFDGADDIGECHESICRDILKAADAIPSPQPTIDDAMIERAAHEIASFFTTNDKGYATMRDIKFAAKAALTAALGGK